MPHPSYPPVARLNTMKHTLLEANLEFWLGLRRTTTKLASWDAQDETLKRELAGINRIIEALRAYQVVIIAARGV